jgi:hypothetical protein
MNPTNTNWTPEGAVRTAIRRMTKHGKSPAAIINVLALATGKPDEAKGNIAGAIRRMKKHGCDIMTIRSAIISVGTTYTKTGSFTTPRKASTTPAKPKGADRSPEQVEDDKKRMAYVRSCRKEVVKTPPVSASDLAVDTNGQPEVFSTESALDEAIERMLTVAQQHDS